MPGRRALSLTVAVTAVSMVALTPAVASATSGAVITTEAGGPGAGPARQLSIDAFDLATVGTNLLVVDNGHDVVRSINLHTGNASVLAGNGTSASRGDGGPARAAALDTPSGIARTSSGITYIADGNRVRAVGTGGRIRTVAGGVKGGFSGDGGPATAARLQSVYGLAVDAAGNLYIADGGNHRIRVVDAATHHIRTVAGDGDETASGDGGSALKAGMSPLNLMIQPSGDILFTDFLNNRVRRISHGVVTTVAGTGDYGFAGDHGPAIAATLANPHGLAAGPDGSIYVTDNGNNRVRQIDAAGTITTVAGNGDFTHSGDGGPATAAGLEDPFGLATDSAGRLFIAEVDGVRLVGTGGRISTIAGDGTSDFGGDGGPATSAQLSDPQGLAVSSAGQVYIADDVNCRIRKLDEHSGTVTTVAGTGVCGYSGDHGPATAAELYRPQAVALDRAGNLLIADTFNLRVRKVDPRTGIITTVAGTGSAGPAGDGGAATAARLDLPYGIAVAPSGDIAISQWHSGTVRVIDHRTGVIRTVAGAAHSTALGDGGPATSASLSSPTSVAYGPGGNLYVADVGHFRIRRVDPDSGLISTVAGTGQRGFSGDGRRATIAQISRVGGLAVGPNGDVYLSDAGNHRVRQIHHGVIRTIAGDGSPALSGDGGSATAAGIPDPHGLALDAAGRLHVSDTSSGRVRIIRGLR